MNHPTPSQPHPPLRATAPAPSPGVHLVHFARPVVPKDRLLRIAEVEHATGLKKSSIYSLAKEGKFPRQVVISRRCSVWPESAVMQWVQDRIASVQEAA